MTSIIQTSAPGTPDPSAAPPSPPRHRRARAAGLLVSDTVALALLAPGVAAAAEPSGTTPTPGTVSASGTGATARSDTIFGTSSVTAPAADDTTPAPRWWPTVVSITFGGWEPLAPTTAQPEHPKPGSTKDTKDTEDTKAGEDIEAAEPGGTDDQAGGWQSGWQSGSGRRGGPGITFTFSLPKTPGALSQMLGGLDLDRLWNQALGVVGSLPSPATSGNAATSGKVATSSRTDGTTAGWMQINWPFSTSGSTTSQPTGTASPSTKSPSTVASSTGSSSTEVSPTGASSSGTS